MRRLIEALERMNARPIAVMFTAVVLSGCIAVDSEVSSQQAADGGLSLIEGRFSCDATYVSKEAGLLGPGQLGHVFDGPQCDAATLSLSNGGSLEVTFEKDGSVLESRNVTSKDGLSHDANSFFLTLGACGIEELQMGCARHTFTIFANQDGDLVIIQSGGGGGIVTVLPAMVYGKLMGIFSRVQDDAL